MFVLSANAASACRCRSTTPQESLQNSEAVFSGRVFDVIEPSSAQRRLGRRNEDPKFLDRVKVTFEVSKVWKGNNERRLVVTTSDSDASCGYSFQEGQEYLVYASGEDAQLKTGLCSGTKPLSDARADLAVLGEGETPSCAQTTPQQSLQNSEAVFSGRVFDVTEQSSPQGQPGRRNEDPKFLNRVKVTFEVSKVWKGNNERRLVVTTYYPSTSSKYSFQEGQEYLVYASGEDAQLKTHSCSETKRLSDARADLAVLGEGETPVNNRLKGLISILYDLALYLLSI